MILTSVLIKQARDQLNMSQVDLANKLFVGQKQISRYENGEAQLNLWQFIAIFELLGKPTEDMWLLFLETHEHKTYRLYKELKTQLRNREHENARVNLESLLKSDFADKPFFQQFFV